MNGWSARTPAIGSGWDLDARGIQTGLDKFCRPARYWCLSFANSYSRGFR